jgi:uncharacterized iron-regulated membrane protein
VKSVLGIIKAHKVATIIISGVIGVSAATGVAFVVINQPAPIEPETSQQAVAEQPEANESSGLSAENVDESQNTVEIQNKTTQVATPTTPAQPSADEIAKQQAEQKKAECVAKATEYYQRFGGEYAREWQASAELQSQYNSPQLYLQSLKAEMESWKISSGCNQYGV